MSGIRVYNFREGDRSEYLANYLLSGLGLVTPVPRQEDIGFDFYCQLADQETGNLSFGYPFIVQVKSDSVSDIQYGTRDNWKKEDIEWISKLELPLFIGIVNKTEMQINIYNCSSLRFVFAKSSNPLIIELKPRIPQSTNDIGKPKEEFIQNRSNENDGIKYIVDLGNPLITITNDDILNKNTLAKRKQILRDVVTLEQQNILYKKLNLQHFHWTLNIETNEKYTAAWLYDKFSTDDIINNLYRSLAPGLISLAIKQHENKNEDLLTQIIPLLKNIPKDIIPDKLNTEYPCFFNQIDEE